MVAGNYKLEGLTGISDVTVIKEGKFIQQLNGRRKKIID
jgi:hypothetical protein